MTQTISSPEPLLVNIVLLILAVGLPILIVLSARFLWDRTVNVGRSKELEKLIWQLHRIASALEHQMNLSFPSVQPGTEDARDIAFLQPLTPETKPATASVATPSATVSVNPRPEKQQPITQQPVAQEASVTAPVLQEPSDAQPPRRAGVNSMFDL
jgi:hypothetical protein